MSAITDLEVRGVTGAIAVRYGLEQRFDGVRVPLRDDGGREICARFRRTRGEGPKTLWLHDPAASCPAADRAYGHFELPLEPADVLYVLEGELKVWIAASRGISAVCGLHGARSARPGVARDIVVAALGVGANEIRVVYDTDPAGVAGAQLMTRTLAALGYLPVSLVPLPTWLDGGGLDDLEAERVRAIRVWNDARGSGDRQALAAALEGVEGFDPDRALTDPTYGRRVIRWWTLSDLLDEFARSTYALRLEPQAFAA